MMSPFASSPSPFPAAEMEADSTTHNNASFHEILAAAETNLGIGSATPPPASLTNGDETPFNLDDYIHTELLGMYREQCVLLTAFHSTAVFVNLKLQSSLLMKGEEAR